MSGSPTSRCRSRWWAAPSSVPRWLRGRDAYVPRKKRGQRVTPEAAFCAEIVASCYIDMGILRDDRRATWYDPGKFWSGDYLPISPGWTLGKEVAVAR